MSVTATDRHQQHGFSMLEVLISLVLLASVLLGATALQLTSLQNNRGAYYRTQASNLAWDIADRIRVNGDFALLSGAQYSVNTASLATPASPACITTTAGCSGGNLAAQDIREWAENFVDITNIGNDGSDYRAVLTGGVGTVTTSGATFSVQVSWTELDWNIGADSNKADTTKNFTLDFTLSE